MRLIDADEAYKILTEYYHQRTAIQHIALKEALDRVPTIDAEPVRHGNWDDTRVAFYRKCSECGATVRNNLSEVFLDCDIRDLHYCPNCGAKMDGEKT